MAAASHNHSPADMDRLVALTLTALRMESGNVAQAPLHSSLTARQQLRRLLTVRSPAPLPDEVRQALDDILQHEVAAKSLTQPADLPRASNDKSSSASRISIWRGDITTLQCSAIVNAANSRLLGCFQPTHRCIDNVIHDAAGPGLRLACQELMEAQGEEEPVGRCKLTPAFNLPSKYVLHTVGPQLDRDLQSEPTAEQDRQLRSCYTSCLDAAAARPDITSVAFCCISTGLFGYPQQAAARVAVATVRHWLDKHRDSTLQHVIFDVFLPTDEQLYRRELGLSTEAPNAPVAVPAEAAASTFTSVIDAAAATFATVVIPPFVQAALSVAQDIVQLTAIPASPSAPLPRGVSASDLDTASSWLRSADSVLVCGGAGISAAAGLDYTSTEIFARLFPAMPQHDFHRFYEAIGKTDWDEELQWGYLLHQLFLARFRWPRSQIYRQVRQITQRVDARNSGADATALQDSRWFVYTSNADGMFEQNGFPTQSIYTIQGDYGRMQCLGPCGPDSYWPTAPFIAAALPHIDPHTQRLPTALVPRCPRCAGPMMMNVRGGNWFLEERPHAAGRNAYHAWLRSSLGRATADRPLVILEVGAGFNTPGVIRFPMERLVLNHPNVRLIRVNAHYPQVPRDVAGVRAVGLRGDAAEIIHALERGIQ